ncbi:hypothetical protein VTK56DRAFT_6856 [Thermocarpiscus australiensis]
MADTNNTPPHLPPSELGTKEYWDALYETELTNHAENPADEGTVWFDDSDAEAKIVEFLLNNDNSSRAAADPHPPPAGLPPSSFLSLPDPARAAVLDLGCGNGSLLFALRDAGWRGRLLGVDYSARSVQLARAVAAARGLSSSTSSSGVDGGEGKGEGKGEGEGEVEFRVWDVVAGRLEDVRADDDDEKKNFSQGGGKEEEEETIDNAGWDVVLDKGTFDAVSLSGERDAQGRRICEGYGGRVLRLLRPGGIFLVTSCNWTEKELREWFEVRTEAAEARLRLAGRIEYPSFSFGGVKGQTISTLCFEKVVG